MPLKYESSLISSISLSSLRFSSSVPLYSNTRKYCQRVPSGNSPPPPCIFSSNSPLLSHNNHFSSSNHCLYPGQALFKRRGNKTLTRFPPAQKNMSQVTQAPEVSLAARSPGHCQAELCVHRHIKWQEQCPCSCRLRHTPGFVLSRNSKGKRLGAV